MFGSKLRSTSTAWFGLLRGRSANAAPRRIGVLLALVLLGTSAAAHAQDGGESDCELRIVPPTARVDGRSYGEWTAAWWQWALSTDVASNPILDPDGTHAAVGQSGPVWFLAGTFGGTAVRNVTIPADKHLLIPLANAEWDTVPGFTNPLGLPDPLSVRDIRDITAFFADNTSVSCEIDGCEVSRPRRFRTRSPVFSLNFNPDLAVAFGYPTAYVRTAVSDGYWLMLRPLQPGTHVIHFTADNPTLGFTLDVTYNITVTP